MRDKFSERYIAAVKKQGIIMNLCEAAEMQLSKADTFIEFCFEKACAQMNGGMDVLTEWRYHKDQYCKITDTIIYDFGHYSRHDASHSISILETIEMLIGDERLVCLSRGDLWLLLENAYSHDIGMALTGQELYELWKDQEFKEYLISSLESQDMDRKRAAEYYFKMNDVLMQSHVIEKYIQDKDKSIFDDYWPAKISNYVKWLVADFIRKHHSLRNMIVRKRVVTITNSVIPVRLYKMATLIAQLHTEDDYNRILTQLKYQEKGIGAELIYPRFAAAMLRIGDVLDVENNRFFLYSIEHMIEMPLESMFHFLKHESIQHIVITTEKVQLEASSGYLEVCRCARQWFDLVEREVKDLIYSWNEITPPLLCGCKLKRSNCHVYYEDKVMGRAEYKLDNQKYFEVNKQKLIELLIGTNIYNMRLDFIREYLQNAMDASKVQLWKDINDGNYDDKINMGLVREGKLTPLDIPKDIYERYRIKLKIETIEGDFENLLLTIEDFGIGMEKECVSVLSNIGTGWRGRIKYNRIIAEMPHWLRPTGGFGIGIQSAFMVTSKVILHTQTEDEIVGRKITLTCPNEGGEVAVEDAQLGHHGTKVQIRIPYSMFLEWNKIISEGQNDVKYQPCSNKISFLDASHIELYTKSVLENYLEQIIPSPFIPIKTVIGGFRGNEKNAEDILKSYRGIRWRDREYKVWGENDWQTQKIWDCKNEILVTIACGNGENAVYYKNVRVTGDLAVKKIISEKLSIRIDIMGMEASHVLKIHRNEFIQDFPLARYVTEYLQLYFHQILINKSVGKLDSNIIKIQMLYTAPEDIKKFTNQLKTLDDKKSIAKWTVAQVEEPSISSLTDGKEEAQVSMPTKDKEKIDIWFEQRAGQESLYNVYLRYLNAFFNQDNPQNFLITSDNPVEYSERYDNSVIWSINTLKTWATSKEKEKETGKEDIPLDEKDSVFRDFFNNGVLRDRFLYDLLLSLNPLDKKYTRYSADLGNGEKLIFWNLVNSAPSENVTEIDEIEFYQKSWNEKNIYFSTYPKAFNCIAIPHPSFILMKNETCVIRPMSEKWITEFKQRYEYNNQLGKMDITKDEFLIEVMGMDESCPKQEMGYLIQWVQDHALDVESRTDRHRIWQAYQRYVGGIYEAAFNNKEGDLSTYEERQDNAE